MKNSNVKLLSMTTSVLLMVMFVPSAFGQASPNTHAVDLFPPGTSETGTLYQFASVNKGNNVPTADASGGFDIISQQIFAFYSPPGVGFNLDTTSPGNCAAAAPTGAQMKWVLFHNAGANGGFALTPATAMHIDVGWNTPSTVFFDSVDPTTVPGILPQNPNAVAGDGFGSGPAATSGTPLPSGGLNGGGFATTHPTGATLTPLLDAIDDTYQWVKVGADGSTPIGGSSDLGATGAAGTITMVICAWLSTDGNNTFDPQVDGTNNVQATIVLERVVGGELMPISATSLLVAGAGANALWILPILGLAGTIIAIRKLEA